MAEDERIPLHYLDERTLKYWNTVVDNLETISIGRYFVDLILDSIIEILVWGGCIHNIVDMKVIVYEVKMGL